MSDETTPEYTPAFIEKLTRFCTYAPGEVVIHEDDTDNQVYYILSGRVKVTNYSIKGREIWHSDMTAGSLFGEMAALTGSPRSVNITAVAPTKLAILTRKEFFELIRHDPDVAIWLLEEMARRLEARTDKMNAVIAQNISQRIQAELLRLAIEMPQAGREMVIKPIPNFTDLARRLNTDRENVSREISTLSRQGVLKKEDTLIRILKPDVLKLSLQI